MDFKEIIVVDYFNNPIADIENNTTKIDEYISRGIDIDVLKICPPGTVIGYPVGELRYSLSIYLPFFSHMSFSLSPGEHAWVVEPKNNNRLFSYWMTRKIGFAESEDINYTVEERGAITSDVIQTFSKCFPEIRPNIDMSPIRKDAIARKEFKGEPVPRFTTPSHATSMQGSNNTLVLLTHNNEIKSGHVDIIACRGQDSLSKPLTIVTNNDDYDEIDKGPYNGSTRSVTEGNTSASDLSRIIASMKFDPDSYFSIDIVPEVGGAGPAVVLKSDQVRIVAKKDFKIQVGEGENASGIIIKSSGDIIILPSALGIVKIGGEDATGALLASKTGINTAGKVTSAPIVSTSGGLLGQEGTIGPFSGNGIFATKILVKIN